MFGSKGPRSKRGGGPSRGSAPEPRSRGGALETVVVESGTRRGGAPPARGAAASESGRVRRAGAVRPAKPRLVDFAADWLSTVLALAQVPNLPDARALRARALELRSRFEREASEQGFTAADIEDAVFAMVAFLDQTVLNSSGPARDAWIAQPLQLELYGRQLAGEEFFERLDRLRHEREARIEALEVYACCLGFGFTGRYLLFPEKLAPLIEEVMRDVAAVRGSGMGPLAPNSARRSERVAEERARLAWWVPLAVFLPSVLVMWLLVWIVGRIGSGGAAGAIEKLLRR